MWTLYKVTCETPNHFYIGVTADLKHRFRQHRKRRGAAFTRKHGATGVEVIARFEDVWDAKAAEQVYVREQRQLQENGGVVAGAGFTDGR